MDRATNSFGFFIQSLSSIDFQVAMMLIIIVVVFVVCHSIRSIVNSYEFIQYIMYGNLASWPDWIATLVHFRLVLLLRHIWFVMFQHYILFIYQQLISLVVCFCTYRKTIFYEVYVMCNVETSQTICDEVRALAYLSNIHQKIFFVNGIFRNDFTLFWQGLIFAKGGAYQVPTKCYSSLLCYQRLDLSPGQNPLKNLEWRNFSFSTSFPSFPLTPHFFHSQLQLCQLQFFAKSLLGFFVDL